RRDGIEKSRSAAVMQQEFRRLALRRASVLLALVVGMVMTLLLDLQAGPANLTLQQIVQGIWNADSLELRHRIILWDVRLPDALIALAVGAALGLSGIETQTVLNNPLASPFTLGISAFAAFGASIAIVFMPGTQWLAHAAVLPLCALVAALACGALVLLFSRLTGGARETVVLFGMALFFLGTADRKSTRLNSSHVKISYAVFCLQ